MESVTRNVFQQYVNKTKVNKHARPRGGHSDVSNELFCFTDNLIPDSLFVLLLNTVQEFRLKCVQ